MYLVKVSFGLMRKGASGDEGVDSVEEYLAALRRNGQISEEYLIANLARPLEAYAQVPRPNSLELRFFSSWGRRTLKKLREIFDRQPSYRLLERPDRSRFPSWRSARSLYLVTDMFDVRSPVRVPEFEDPIPLYLLPISSQQRDYLDRWAQKFRDHDRIWIGSGALEIPAYRQLADPKSELSQEGREHCKEIEAGTGKPTYYYLWRYYGRRKGESNRLCPVCGKDWTVRRHDSHTVRFARFDFRCRPCRLVSHMATSDEDERHARIGEFRSRRKSAGTPTY